MFSGIRSEEEVFARPFTRKVERKIEEPAPQLEIPAAAEPVPSMDANSMIERLDRMTEQINTISKYLAHLSERLNEREQDTGDYERNLDEIEVKMDGLKRKIDGMGFHDTTFSVQKSAGKAK